MSHVAPDAAVPRLVLDPDQLLGQLAAVEQLEAINQSVGGRQVEDVAAIVRQCHVQSWMGQCHPGELFGDVAKFGGRPLEKLAANRGVGEQAGDVERRAGWPGGRLRGPDVAVVDDQLGSGDRLGGATADDESADLRDRCQCFATESHRVDAKQILGRADLAGGVCGDGQQDVVGVDSFSVVDDPDPLAASLFDLDINPGRQGIDAVLQQFLDHARRPLDHLAGGDLVDDPVVELLDSWHCGKRFLPAPRGGDLLHRRCAPLIPAGKGNRNGRQGRRFQSGLPLSGVSTTLWPLGDVLGSTSPADPARQ